VTATQFLKYLACWQHVDEAYQLEGPMGVAEVVRQLAGYELPAAQWERNVLRQRVRDYRREYLDQLTLSGQLMWGRLWGAGHGPIKTAPVCIWMREDLDAWRGLACQAEKDGEDRVETLSGYARPLYRMLCERGAVFPQELQTADEQMPEHFEQGLAELIGQGLATCDSFGGLRALIVPPSKRRGALQSIGRWSLFRPSTECVEAPEPEFVAKQLLKRYGVIFRRMLTREKQPVPWRDLLRVLRRMELRGEVRGGRFVAGFDGEQFGLPEAVSMVRKIRKAAERPEVNVSAADPLNLRGILTPDERISPLERKQVKVG